MSQAQVHNRNHSARVNARRRRDVVWPLGTIGGARTLFRIVGRAAIVQTYEVGLMASLAATVPLHLAGGSFEPAVGAAALARTAPTACPVLLVHGFGGTKASWSFLARTLTARGLTVDAITYSPFGTSVEQLADRLAVRVERLLSHTGADKVHLVGHSLGGVVIAQAIASGRLTGRVDTVVTLASPFGGVHHIKGSDLSSARAGLRRLAAITGGSVGSERIWMGETWVSPETVSDHHHHGESETAIFVRSGNPEFVFHDGVGEAQIVAAPGDYIFVPPYLLAPRREPAPPILR